MSKSERHCLRCGGGMVRGLLRFRGLYESDGRIAFVIPGVPTSRNLIAAFRQGLADEPGDEVIELEKIGGSLCRACGYLEFHAWIDEGSGETELGEI